ncbi:MAG: YifB family Mg chelatase-like AAA ATPase [Candidatus Microsaccharimonas sp.]
MARVLSGAPVGFTGALIEVETDIKAGLPGLQIVGMGNKAIDEARQRVRSAISNSLLDFPAQKITVNLAPAELPKDGTHLDLPIALSVLIASGQLKQSEVAGALFAGELALDGTIRPIRGAVVLAELAKNNGAQRFFVPQHNVAQAQLITGLQVIGVQTLQALYKALKGVAPFTTPEPPLLALKAPSTGPGGVTFDEIVGHEQAKRALTIAAAGRHNILLSGSPGAGKTLLAKSLPSLLPPLVDSEVVEVTKLHSLASGNEGAIQTLPPFRAPHHTATLTSFIGGGLRPRPGTISLAHKGVLFLDELPEHSRSTLEALRQPLEDRTVSLSRLYEHITYPADVLLIATMNPCPCGYLGDSATNCTCSAMQINAYQRRISGPLLDRIDIRVTVSKVKHEHFFDAKSLKNKQQLKVLKLILIAREAQKKRYKRSDAYNAYATIEQAKQLFCIDPSAKKLLSTAATTLQLTSRSALRVLRVARTIADLEASETLNEQHIAEALQFR